MFSTKLIQSSLNDLKRITKAEYALCDDNGNVLVSTLKKIGISVDILTEFMKSSVSSQNSKGYYLQKIGAEEVYGIVAYAGGADCYMFSQIAASEISHLMELGTQKMEKEEFYRELLAGNLLAGEIYSRAQKLKLRVDEERCIFAIDVEEDYLENAKELIKNIFSDSKDNMILVVNDSILVAMIVADGNVAEEIATMIVNMINTELLIRARVTYGASVKELKESATSYEQAMMAMEVAKIFYEDLSIASYASLGLGRLIHQLPPNLCKMFIKEVFGEDSFPKLTKEDLMIIDKFFAGNLNTSETARMLNMHRTTFIYKLDRINKKIGMDIRKFEDAMTLKVAMMVTQYMNYSVKQDIH